MKTIPPVPADDAAPASASASARALAKAVRRRAAPKAANDGPRGGEARALADLMPAVGATSFRRFGFIQGALVTRWAEIVGDRLGAVTRPDALRFPRQQKAEGTLHLTIAGAHAPMLQHVAPDLIERVNRFFGYRAVARVRMTQGLVVAAQQQPPAEPPRVQPPVSGPGAGPRTTGPLPDGLRAVADAELRTVLERMAARLDDAPRLPRIS